MNPMPKTAIIIADTGVTNGETASAYIDTKGFDYAVIDVIASTSDDTTNNFSTLTLSEGDTTSAWTAVSTGDTDFDIPAADTSATSVVAQMRVPLEARARYLKLAITPLTTQSIHAIAHLYKGDALPVSATAAGADVLVDVA